MSLKFTVPRWDEIHIKLLDLSLMIRSSGFKPDVIVGIARGGWIVARLLSDLLDIGDIASLRIEFYKDVASHRRSPIITQPVSMDVRGKKVLAADDVADTGSSLKAAVAHLLEKGAEEIRVATIHVKPWSNFIPDYFVDVTDEWVIYPWEPFETLKSLANKWFKEGLSFNDVKIRLLNIGMQRIFVDKLLPIAWRSLEELNGEN